MIMSLAKFWNEEGKQWHFWIVQLLNNMSNTLYILLDMTSKNLIGSLSSKENLDGSNYDAWHLKVEFILNKGDILDLLTTSMLAPTNKDEHGKNITASE